MRRACSSSGSPSPLSVSAHASGMGYVNERRCQRICRRRSIWLLSIVTSQTRLGDGDTFLPVLGNGCRLALGLIRPTSR
jgi:hypothetical protein